MRASSSGCRARRAQRGERSAGGRGSRPRVVDAHEAAVEAEQRHADRGVVEGAGSAPRPRAGAVGDALLGHVARHDDASPSISPVAARYRRTCMMSLCWLSAKTRRSPSCPPSAPAMIGSVAAQRAPAGTISDDVAADHRGAVDAGALQVRALEQQAAQFAVVQADRRPGHALQHDPVRALAVAQAVLGRAARAAMPEVPALWRSRAPPTWRQRRRRTPGWTSRRQTSPHDDRLVAPCSAVFRGASHGDGADAGRRRRRDRLGRASGRCPGGASSRPVSTSPPARAPGSRGRGRRSRRSRARRARRPSTGSTKEAMVCGRRRAAAASATSGGHVL